MISEEKSEICFQSLQHYNEGMLIFKWYVYEDFSSFSEMWDDFKEYVLNETGDEIEEWMIADYSFSPDFGEYPDSEEIDEYIELLNSGNYPTQAIIDYFENTGSFDCLEDSYEGEYDDEENFAYQLVDDLYDLEETMGNLYCYFDYEKFARDLFISDYWMSDNGFVFRNI